MNRKLLITGAVFAAVAAVAVPATGNVSAGVCSELQAARDYHDWVGGMWVQDPAFTEAPGQNREYVEQLDRWLEIYNCSHPGAQ